jgi:hypothetical protein
MSKEIGNTDISTQLADGTLGSVKCPVHGEHAMTSHGRCWYCVQSGMIPPDQAADQTTGNKVVLAYEQDEPDHIQPSTMFMSRLERFANAVAKMPQADVDKLMSELESNYSEKENQSEANSSV